MVRAFENDEIDLLCPRNKIQTMENRRRHVVDNRFKRDQTTINNLNSTYVTNKIARIRVRVFGRAV